MQSFQFAVTGDASETTYAGGTLSPNHTSSALDQPKEYGPHWEGFADRYGRRKSVVITGDAIEASAGLPAYARYAAILGSNFLSNTWRVHSEANAYDAILRASGGFTGRMATNAFEEFWPDVKKRVFRKRY
jgi:hypothetical protein